MRNFEERKAEIFRRSEVRIKERRKNRIRFLASVVPLFICIAVLSVIYLPDMMMKDGNNFAEEDADESANILYTEVTVECNGNIYTLYNKESDSLKVKDIYGIIDSSFACDDMENETATNNDTTSQNYATKDEGVNNNEPPKHSATDITKKLSYTITFSSTDGTKAVYTLNGNKIINKTTKEEATLTGAQLTKLQKALGLEKTQKEGK